MDPAAGRDFFISYTGVNRAWAEWIAVELERAGYTTVLQALDFSAGNDFVHEMHVASTTATRTIAVLSPAYFQSAMGEAEWRVAFESDPSGELQLLVPVRVQAFEGGGLLKTRVYIDLVDLEEAEARQRLLADVGRVVRAGPRQSTAVFPGGRPTAISKPATSGGFPGAGAAISNLPPRNRNFTGRGLLLDQIHADLQAASAAAVVPTEVVHGLGGIGKSQLAVEYAHRFGSDYDIAWWIPAEQPIEAAQALTALAMRLNIPAAVDPTEMITGLFELLRGRDRWLLVYDNAERPEQLIDLLPPGDRGHVLVTSRWQAWRGQAMSLTLGVLSRLESIEFLRQRTDLDDPSGWDAVADVLGDLPLALDEAAAYVEETGIAAVDYLELIRVRSQELLFAGLPPGDGNGDGDRRRVATVWSVSLDRVRQEEPAAQALLNLCAFLAPDIPRGLPTEAPELLLGGLGAVVLDSLAYNRVVAVIGRYSLAAVAPATVGVHRLVQSVIRARFDSVGEEYWAEAATNLVRARFPNDSWETSSWPGCERLLPQVLAVTGHAERLGVALEAAGWLLDRVSTYLRERGQYRQAKPLAERAVTLTESALGPDHPDLAWRHETLGRLVQAMGDLAGARAEYGEALRIGEAALGPDHPDVGVWRNDLGTVLRDLGDLIGARTHLEEALRISEAALGPDHPDVGIRRSNLAGVLLNLGDLVGARTNLEEALRIGEAALGPEHPTIGTWRSNLGLVLRDLGELDGARTEMEEALRIGEAALGPEHPTIGTWRNNLGLVLRDLGDLNGARTHLEEALRISEAALDTDHPDIGIRRSSLGAVLRDLGDLVGARTEMEEALRIGEAALGSDHPTIGVRRNNLGNVLLDLGDLAGGRTQLGEALRISEAALGPDHPTLGIRRHNLGAVLLNLGDLAGARTQFGEALRISEAALGPYHPTVRTIRGILEGLPEP